MKIPYRKDIAFYLVLVAVSTLLFIGAKIYADYIGNSISISTYIFSGIYFLDASIFIVYAFAMDKINVKHHARFFAIFHLSISLIMWVLSFAFAFAVLPPTQPSFYIVFFSLVLCIISRALLTMKINDTFSKENSGLFYFKVINNVGLIYFATYLVGFVTNVTVQIIFHFIDITSIKIINDVPVGFFAALIFILVFTFLTMMTVIYFCISLLISAKEKRTVDFRYNYRYAILMFQKYHLTFWFSMVFNFFFMLSALLSMIFVNMLYIGMFLLFATILVIRIPTFFFDLHLEKKYKDDELTLFKKKHWIVLYVSIILFAYAVLQAQLGPGSLSKLATKQEYNLIVAFGFFLPWAIIKLAIGVFSLRLLRKSANPSIFSNAYSNMILAIYALTNAFCAIALSTQNSFILMLGIFMMIAASAITGAFGIHLLIFSIRGLTNKRAKKVDSFISYRKKTAKNKIALLESLENI